MTTSTTLSVGELSAWFDSLDATQVEILLDRTGLGRERDWTGDLAPSDLAEVWSFLRDEHPHFDWMHLAFVHDEFGALSHIEVQAEVPTGMPALYIGTSTDMDDLRPSIDDDGRDALRELVHHLYELYTLAYRAALALEHSK